MKFVLLATPPTVTFTAPVVVRGTVATIWVSLQLTMLATAPKPRKVTVLAPWLARFLLVWLGERVLRVVPRGVHDPDRFIRPGELGALLASAAMKLMATCGLRRGQGVSVRA